MWMDNVLKGDMTEWRFAATVIADVLALLTRLMLLLSLSLPFLLLFAPLPVLSGVVVGSAWIVIISLSSSYYVYITVMLIL